MATEQINISDPLEFVRSMWGNMGFSLPGMVAPTFDVDELEKRITDLKAVESWLRMNLSMLQMTIQGLEMQTATLTAVKAMGTMASNAMQQGAEAASPAQPAVDPAATGALAQAMWPWNMMQQMQEHLQQQAEAIQNATPEGAATKAANRKARKS